MDYTMDSWSVIIPSNSSHNYGSIKPINPFFGPAISSFSHVCLGN